MHKVHNDTGLALGWFWCQQDPPNHRVTFVLKGTFSLTPNAPATIAPAEQRLLLTGDVHHDDDTHASVRYASDFAPFKPRADVLVVGTCHQPGGEARSAARVGLRVGSLAKSLLVLGDRCWVEHPHGGLVPGEAKPFRSLPLRYEHAFGGPDCPANPTGKGAAKPGQLGAPPNIEHEARLLRAPTERVAAAGFGAIDRRWADRAGLAGTYDERWLGERWPWFPADFDWGYFNAAPRDQQLEGYLRGDEPIALDGLSPDGRPIVGALPALRPRLLVRRTPELGQPSEEVALRLDTLWIDADSGTLVCTWRGSIAVRDKRFSELYSALCVTEPLAEAPLPKAAYDDETRWSSAEPSEEQLAEQEEQAARAAGQSEEDAGDDAEALADARRMLAAGDAPAALLSKLSGVTTLDGFLSVLHAAEATTDDALMAHAEAEAEAAKARFAAEHAAELAELDEHATADVRTRSPLTRSDVIARASAKVSLAGADLAGLDLSNLDLSDVDLSGANLRGTCLAGSLFAGATLTGADLTGAWAAARPVVLSGANLTDARLDHADLRSAVFCATDLTRASLRGAKLMQATLAEAVLAHAALDDADLESADLSHAALGHATLARARLSHATLVAADLSHALLTGATLDGTALTEAAFDDADLTGVSLQQAHGYSVSLRGARLDSASFAGAGLPGGNFAGASLDATSFERADLSAAVFEASRGVGPSFLGAKLDNLRAAGCFLQGARVDGASAAGAVFSGAHLASTSFVGAALDRADLSEANLEATDFHRATLRHANLTMSNLKRATLTQVNLFRGQLESADLTDTDCRGSSLFECELYDARVVGARFDGTNLARTKLQGESVTRGA